LADDERHHHDGDSHRETSAHSAPPAPIAGRDRSASNGEHDSCDPESGGGELHWNRSALGPVRCEPDRDPDRRDTDERGETATPSRGATSERGNDQGGRRANPDNPNDLPAR
jgi:hypothetical protein